MPAQQFGLALAFLQSQPAAAARLLERHPPADVATFLSNVPFAHATSVFSRMLPHYSAAICEKMPAEPCAAILAPLSNTALAAVLRHLPTEIQGQLNDLFPEKVRLTLRIVFNYSADSVGAWMIPNVLSLPSDCDVKDALDRIAENRHESDHDLIPVVDRTGLLQGEISLRALLMASPDVTISSIMLPADLRLLGRANLETESKNLGWQTRDNLPVVNRTAHLVGVLRHVDLRRGLVHSERPADDQPNQGILSQMLQAYSACFIALANTLFESDKR